MMAKISPSLAAAPQDRLGQAVRALEQGGADYVHVDIEDGVFVPVMTLGVKIIPDLRPLTDLPFDVHLMMVNPEWILPELVHNGADRIAVHLEACPYPRRTLGLIDELGAVPGLALNPITPLPDLSYLQPYLKFIILLSTEPDTRDTAFLPEVLEKLRQGRQTPGLEGVEWVIDGGVGPNNLAEVIRAGADTVVIGRAAFRNDTVADNLREIRQLIAAAEPGVDKA